MEVTPSPKEAVYRFAVEFCWCFSASCSYTMYVTLCVMSVAVVPPHVSVPQCVMAGCCCSYRCCSLGKGANIPQMGLSKEAANRISNANVVNNHIRADRYAITSIA